MKNLKIFLCFSLLIYIIFTIVTCNYKSNYNDSTKTIVGTINNYNISEDKITFEVIGKEKIIATFYHDNKNIDRDFELGDTIKLEGTIKKPKQNTVFNLFNYQNYLLSKKIYWTFTIEKYQIIKKNTNILYKIKNNIINRIDKIDNDYLYSFILGDNKKIDENVYQSFSNNGITHLFAISGMHVSLLTGLLLYLLHKISHKDKINYIFLIMFLLFYTFITGFSPSILRASLMFTILFLNKECHLKLKTIEIVIICALILLTYNPFYIYHLGFQFSFVVSFFLISFNEIINRHNNYFMKVFIISLISFVAGIPIMINNFFYINLLTPFYNIVFVPFVSVILFPFSLLTFIFPILTPILNILVKLLEYSSMFLENYNLKLVLSHINIYVFILYYIVIYITFYLIKKKQYQGIILLVTIIIIHTNIKYIKKDAVITMIDVKQGDSILIELPYNKGNILVDTGGEVSFNKQNSSYSIVKKTTIPYLYSRGIKKLDFLILSHGDFDHMGEWENLLNNFKVDNVILNSYDTNDLEKELKKYLNKNKINYQEIDKLSLNINNNILNLISYPSEIENENSILLHTTLNNKNILLMGDAGVETEKKLINEYNLENIDILKIGHHGSKNSTSEEFLDRINPKYALISVGKNNLYGHPHKEVLDNLKDSKIYRTDKQGSIMFKIKNNKLKIETCSP